MNSDHQVESSSPPAAALGRGTFACPICGYDKPHPHSAEAIAAYREDQIRDDGWTSCAKQNPAEAGWYLCHDVEVPINRPNAHDGWDARTSQLSWFLWVRDGASRGDKVPEVLYFDRTRWSLRNLLGNASVSGRESRHEVEARPRYWREVPALPALNRAASQPKALAAAAENSAPSE